MKVRTQNGNSLNVHSTISNQTLTIMEAPMNKSDNGSEEATERDKLTVTFDVGGQTYAISRNIVMSHPDTMLARIASETWQKDPTATIFINGDGERFRYVLDYLRTGSISLPITVSKPAILKDLEYYGFENINPNNIDGWGNASLEAAAHIGKKEAKKDELVEEIDAKIETLKLEKAFVSIAHNCFVQCCSKTCTMEDIGLGFTEHLDAFYHGFDEELFNKSLAEYGLYHINHGHRSNNQRTVSLGLLSTKEKPG
jgi:hypothetical protein